MKFFLLAFFVSSVAGSSEECSAGDVGCDAGEGDDSALLALRSSQKSGVGGCKETLFQGLCYTACSSMDAMEPRQQLNKCGGQTGSYAKHCTKDGEQASGGRAPGSGGRNQGQCFGNGYTGYANGQGQKFCTDTNCAPDAKKSNMFCCDGNDQVAPNVTVSGGTTSCSCPSNNGLFGGATTNTLESTGGCSTGCQHADAWMLVMDVAYCCPGNRKPTVNPTGVSNLVVQCTC